MSKEQKSVSEERHRKVHRFLEKQFPGCEVIYNGLEGIDHRIIFNNKTTWVETKTCNRIERCGIDRKRSKEYDGPLLFEKHRLGRIKFNQLEVDPYTHSQHYDLVEQNGWYIFVIDRGIIGGMSAHKIHEHIQGKWTEKRVTWSKVIGWCHPEWVKQLKAHIYF